MFEPKFKILLKKENFYPNQVVCLGSQFITIINFMKNIFIPHVWYIADIDALSILPRQLEMDSFFVKNIGDDSSLIKICFKIKQFLSGVFLAIKVEDSNQIIESTEVGTEDEEFRSIDLKGVLLEIRAFDTSFFELYSESQDIMSKLAEAFNVEIIQRDENR